MRTVPFTLWVGALAIFLSAHCLAAGKWWLLTDQTQIPFKVFLKAHFLGLLGNLCLPSVAGGDVVRATWVLRQGIVRARIGVASITDRMVDTICLLVLAGVGAVFVTQRDERAHRLLLMISFVLIVGMIGLAIAVVILMRWRTAGQ